MKKRMWSWWACKKLYGMLSEEGRRKNKLAILGFPPFNRFCRQSCKSGIHPVSLASLRGKMVMMSTLVHCLLCHFDTPSLHKLNGVWKVSSLLLSTPNSDSCDPRVAFGWTAPGCCQPQKVCHSNFYLTWTRFCHLYTSWDMGLYNWVFPYPMAQKRPQWHQNSEGPMISIKGSFQALEIGFLVHRPKAKIIPCWKFRALFWLDEKKNNMKISTLIARTPSKLCWTSEEQ